MKTTKKISEKLKKGIEEKRNYYNSKKNSKLLLNPTFLDKCKFRIWPDVLKLNYNITIESNKP
jgi:hypothetical protein